MRATQYLLATIKDIPKDCEIISHQLMLRSGMIRQVSSGLYAWLPTGLRVLKNIEYIIREEINKIGFVEILMPITQPSKLWKTSGRWLKYGKELLRFKNHKCQEFILSPTYEEMISDIFSKEVIVSTQFPIKLYQIYTKYRDEIRPRFGMIRSREFIMKDGYSFHTDHKSLQNTYNNVYNTYITIFNRFRLKFCIVQADPGNIGGTLSHEFQAYSKHGEDKIATPITTTLNDNILNLNNFQNTKNLAPIKIHSKSPQEKMKLIQNFHNIPLMKFLNELNLSIKKTIKIIIVRASNRENNSSYDFLGLIIRADHELNYKKLSIISEIYFPISILNPKEIQKIIKVKPTLKSFIDLSIPLIIDYHVAMMSDFVIESDKHNQYFFGVNWHRDFPMPKIADLYMLRNFNSKKNIQKTNGLIICNSIEIGHIFQLGNKYTNCFPNWSQKNNQNQLQSITMGCYGIGVTRVIAVIIEQNHDQNGIIWPDELAPFTLAIIPINMYRNQKVSQTAERLYHKSISIGIDVLIYDRQDNPGIMFSNIDLIGIPHILIISDRNLKNQEVEYKYRKTGTIQKIKLNKISQFFNTNFCKKKI